MTKHFMRGKMRGKIKVKRKNGSFAGEGKFQHALVVTLILY